MFRDVSIMRREVVSLQTEWADPYSCALINLAEAELARFPSSLLNTLPESVQYCSTWRLACDRFVLQKRIAVDL